MRTQDVICTIIALSGGLLFGYNLGISGGVTLMNGFLVNFFPKVHEKKQLVGEKDRHCIYNNQSFQLFASSLYVAGAVSTVVASICYKRLLGRKCVMRLAALFFVLGTVLQSSAVNLFMLILGRTFLGAGLGFTNQVVPLFISPNSRVGQLLGQQVLIAVGIFIANLVNLYAFIKLQPYAWRISLAGSAVPAFFIAIASIFISDDNDDHVLQKASYREIVVHMFMKKRSTWPHLFCGTMIQIYKQLAGNIAILLYSPLLFETIIGLDESVSLIQTVFVGEMNVISTLAAVFLVYKLGTRELFIVTAILMFSSQVLLFIGGILARRTNLMVSELQGVVIQFINVFVIAFSCSWGTLGWLITSKAFRAVEDETICSAMSLIAVTTNFLCASVIAQTSLTIWCHVKGWILFFFFSAWIVVMTVFACDYLPAIEGITKSDINSGVWRKHWYWKRFYDQVYNAKQPKGFKKKKNKSEKWD